jgi:hypothetical protein
MLKCIRLSQIVFKSLLEEMQGHAYLKVSVVLKNLLESVLKKALAPAVRPGAKQASASPEEYPRIHAKASSIGTVDFTEIAHFLTEPSKLRESQAREKELQTKLAAMEAEDTAVQFRLGRLARARACGLLLRAGLRARVRLQARNHARELARLGEQNGDREDAIRLSREESVGDL